MPESTSAARLTLLLAQIRRAEREYRAAAGRSDAVAMNAHATAYIGATNRLLGLLKPRQVQGDTQGGTLAVTVDAVDVHIRSEADRRRTYVAVGTETVAEGRRVFVESWDSMTWEHEV